MSTNDSPLVVSHSDGITHMMLNRPDKKNAINIALYQAMTQTIIDAEKDSKTRVLLISGAGGNFTSGNDLEDFANLSNPDLEHPTPVFMKTLYNFPKPVVVAVEGSAVGIGTTLLMHCDLVYAATNTQFQMPFVNLGLIPEYASTLFLPQMAGQVKAAELLMLGETFDVETAKECGLINRSVAAEELIDYAMERAKKLAAQPPSAIRITKKLLRDNQKEAGMKVIDNELPLFFERLQSDEFSEAVTAFFEKRKPDFSRFD